MMRKSLHPSQKVLRDWLDYDPTTGIFIWKKEPRSIRHLLGKQAGTKNKTGYRLIGIRGFYQKKAARLAWIYMNGEIPDNMEVDHIDNNPSNDRLKNLRLATSSQQKMNRRVQSNSRSGLKGAYYHTSHKGKKWRSQLKVNGKFLFLGYFHTPMEAHLAYCAAAPHYYREFVRLK